MSIQNEAISGIHHVTAITADAQKNIDFYYGVLGLRLVKLTVNFDDPSSYHLYYGDELGRPGTILTFFAWPGAYRGRIGPPQVSVTAFAVPAGAVDYWLGRLKEHSIQAQSSTDRFGERVLSFADPDGMSLELIGVTAPKGEPWRAGPVPAEHSIRGFHGVTISEEGYENTAKLLTETMGFKAAGSEQNRFRYRAAGDAAGTIVDLLCVPDARHGNMGAGVVHHVAFRTPDDSQQAAWRNKIAQLMLNVSPVMDRVYFHSIYYREPGGVLFEIATDNPGFTMDEPAEKLGSGLKLPPWLEEYRTEIQRAVPPVRLPVPGQ
ncbi:MAG TPA: ring-cleaving dioxygenase [Phycisphaerae bacterium]|nr:ring-cleaving dioxygenase [Phycisphaerae bacterium]